MKAGECVRMEEFVNLSPRIRADYLLLIEAPNPRQCLEAFASEKGVLWCSDYPGLAIKASQALPDLPVLLKSLPAFLVADAVLRFLEGSITDVESFDITGLTDE